MRICGTLGVSAIDFPGRVSTVLFLGGCNFRCPFCHNPDLVLRPGETPDIDEADLFAELARKKGFIDGVVVTGGEPLIHGDNAVSLLGRLKDAGLAVKLDTNGYEVEVLSRVLTSGFVDYVAMDVKTSMGKYASASGIRHIDTSRIEKAISLISTSGVAHEFRTTCVPGLVEGPDVDEVAQRLGPSADYYLQQFRAGPGVIDATYASVVPHSPDVVRSFADIARPYVRRVGLRGV